MEEEFLLLLIETWQDAFNINNMKLLRDCSDPFNLPAQVFEMHFLLPKSMCRSLIEDLLPYDKQDTSLPLALRFLTTVNFYTSGSFPKRSNSNKIFDISQPSMSRSLSSITELLVTQKGDEICFPGINESQAVVKKGFKEQFDMDNTLGVIGTAHIKILAPKDKFGSEEYFNEHGEYSIKVEGICDHRLLFTSLNARSPGSLSNSSIWRSSSARQFLIKHYKLGSRNTWLLGDVTYPLEPWLLTPVTPRSRLELSYNDRNRRAHNCIKQAFAVLRTRFKCLSKGRRLYYKHERAANIIYACAILHNILLKNGGSATLDKNELQTSVEESSTKVSEKAALKCAPKFVDGTHVRHRYTQHL
ncbi:putative nuclease HARBI1 [Anastrepha obliqua]|uniref:putative nuclease HARBI1 n=1 Tax=Anastrepha obliqua TaxID=95512 RepID=UPI00240A95C6|nr:putative nuclease HARBI1 [Anastrepha obliqua]